MPKYLLPFLITIPIYANAYFLDGNKLDSYTASLDKSNNGEVLSIQQVIDSSTFLGYVAGVFDSGIGIYFCPKSNLEYKQVTDIVTIYLRYHPEKRNEKASDLVIQSLSERFPCKK
ncbi:Rap1a/Tai family immunity protein [Proteus mirabilis]|uniref:Rap1a/Tai family immunity protein n=1 Tax=Proteus mirabilis TaxID=584 RepID=UPI001A35B385|nr:Rap1a/Tai family immunity protein [Proteus mirabilis]EGT3592081.1 hypothetical protein [Proteus mirabilis]WOR92821.1 Rap1a/Tai family immunity protein [Proteus mirabilis]WOS11720.1 Rap1a/Tai family immunity protein [Proteus mirabilis]HAU5528450.1 hypothetical protein [Proteus mirabilis]HAU5535663.1 hypothetical protein [Proteus mirabilis]